MWQLHEGRDETSTKLLNPTVIVRSRNANGKTIQSIYRIGKFISVALWAPEVTIVVTFVSPNRIWACTMCDFVYVWLCLGADRRDLPSGSLLVAFNIVGIIAFLVVKSRALLVDGEC